MPKAKLGTDYSLKRQAYYSADRTGEKVTFTDTDVKGEENIFTIRDGSRTLVRGGGDTSFPHKVPASTISIPASVEVLTTMSLLFRQPEFRQEDLLKLAQSRIPEVRVGALANSQDQAVLTKLVLGLTGWMFSETLVRKISDQALLAKIAAEHQDSYVRQAAVEKLTDQAVLAEIALKGGGIVREAALKKLTDQAVLAKFATEDKDLLVRMAAEEKLTDQARLLKSAEEDPNSFVRQAAVEKLTDQAALAKFAVGYHNRYVRLAATKKLTDRALLAKIAAEDEDADVRGFAKDRLVNLRARRP